MSFFWVAVAYAVAFTAAALALHHGFGLEGLIWKVLVADLAATVAIFVFSFAFRNTSIYDPYWSIAPGAVVLYLALNAPEDADAIRTWVAVAVVMAYSLRLTLNWIFDWQGLHQEDWRYDSFRDKVGRFYWPFSLFGFHIFPTIQVFLGLLPLFFVISNDTNAPFGLWDALGAAVVLIAVVIEGVADAQLHRFRHRKNKVPGEFITTGLWAYSRHPNYFGEVLFWFGLWLCAMAIRPTLWWTGIGWVAIVAMFYGYSIPAQDAKVAETRPGYKAHMKQVSSLILWWPSKAPDSNAP